MDHDQIPSSVAFDTTTIPTFRIVEPTPEKGKDRGQELTLTDSTLPLHRILSSHRVLYRGSLSFPTSESDIPLEGPRPLLILPVGLGAESPQGYALSRILIPRLLPSLPL